MSEIKVTLPDGSEKAVAEGDSVLDLAKQIGSRLAKAAVAGKVNGEVCGLTQALQDGDAVEILTFDAREGQDVFRHSAAHLMASAILRVRP